MWTYEISGRGASAVTVERARHGTASVKEIGGESETSADESGMSSWFEARGATWNVA
jgi:hypothetical protein